MSLDIKELFKQVAQELKDEEEARRTPEERKLHEFCQWLLLLERDLRVPGAARTQDDRVARILAELAKTAL
jgi:hypothetical protein